jgi:hypothetical protein
MAKFDVEGARRAGYTDAEIADFLAGEAAFDTAAARAAGYTDAEIVSHLSGPSTPVKTPRTDAAKYAEITTGVLAPYATAALAGGAVGGTVVPALGAIPGAAGGVLSLGVADLGTALYNLGGSLFDAERIPLPSETIRKGYESIGIGSRPETPGQQVYSDVLEAGTGAFSQGKAAQNLFKTGSQPVQNFMREMGQNVRGQTFAGAAAGGAPSVASNYFDVENPYALAGLSLAAGATGGKVATPKPKPIPSGVLKSTAEDLYKQMEAENINVSGQAMADLVSKTQAKLKSLRYDPDTAPGIVNEALELITKKSGKPISYVMLEELRKNVRDIPYNQAGGARGTDKERAIVNALDELIDEYMDGLTPEQTTFAEGRSPTNVNFGGREYNTGFGIPNQDVSIANARLKEARAVRAQGYKTETLENAVKRATASSSKLDGTKSFGRALRDEFGSIATNERKLSKFDAPTQELIKKVANGTATQKVLMTLGRLSPNATPSGIKGLGYGASAYVAPTTTAALATGGATAEGIANQMTKKQVNRALVSASQPRGVKPSSRNVMAQTAQQTLLAQERARIAAEYNFPDVDPESGEPLVDIDFSEGYAAPMYGTLSKDKQFQNINKMRR